MSTTDERTVDTTTPAEIIVDPQTSTIINVIVQPPSSTTSRLKSIWLFLKMIVIGIVVLGLLYRYVYPYHVLETYSDSCSMVKSTRCCAYIRGLACNKTITYSSNLTRECSKFFYPKFFESNCII